MFDSDKKVQYNTQPGNSVIVKPDWLSAFNFNDSNVDLTGNTDSLILPSNTYQAGNAGRGLRFITTDVSSTTGRIVSGINGNTLTAIMIVEPVVSSISNNFLYGESSSGTGTYNWGFYESSAGEMRAFVHNGTTGSASTSGFTWGIAFRPQVWVLTYDGTTISLWLDGVLRGTSSLTGNVQRSATAHLSVQRWNTSGSNFKLYAAAVSNRFFPLNEIADKFRSPESAYNAIFENRTKNIPVSYNPDPGIQNASIAHGPYPLVQRPSVLAKKVPNTDYSDFEVWNPVVQPFPGPRRKLM